MEYSKEQFYQRQTSIAEFGDAGQEKLGKAKIIIIGCGGLGNIAAVYLAASGIGKIHLVDFDTIQISNLHRQVFFKPNQIGKSKCEILAKYIEQIAPHVEISYSNEPISKSNILETIDPFNIVLDCTDNLSIKYLINDACVIKDKVLVYGSLYKFDGYVASFNVLENATKRTANLRDAFPEIPKNHMPNCSEIGTLNTIVGTIGLLQANEVIKLASGIGKVLTNQILIYNSLDNSQFHMRLKPEMTKNSIEEIFTKSDYLDDHCEIQDENLLISAEALKHKLITQKIKIISVIEDVAFELPFDADVKIPLSKFSDWISTNAQTKYLQLHPDHEIILVCKKGISSYTATKIWRETYLNAPVFSLKNGVDAY